MELEKLREENARLRRERDQLRGTVDAFREQSSKESAEAIVEDVVRGIVDHIAESGQVAILRRANEELKEKYDAMAREVLVLENLVGKLQSNAAEASAASNAAVEEEVIDIILDDDDSSSIASFTLKADVFEHGNGESADYPKTPLTPGSQTAWGRFKKRIRGGLGLSASSSAKKSTPRSSATVLQQKYLSAAQDLDRETMLDCADDGVLVSCTDFDGTNAVHKVLLSRRDDALVEDDILAMICWLNEELGVGVNEKTRDGRTALHYACRKGRLLVSQWLEERGAEMDAETDYG